jgi:hypothetical protein
VSRFTKAAIAYAKLGWPIVPCHWPLERDGMIVCSCCHKPDPDDPTRCGCGHHRSVPNAPCDCGRPDCRARCTGKPCSNIGKHPRTEHGLKDATTEPDQIRAWGERWPDANIAIVLGAPAGIFAFDLDRHCAEQDGIDGFADVCRELGVAIPDTPVQLTGGGGQQVIFRHPGPHVSIGNRTGANALRPGVEVKGDGGYIVAAPSMHRSGRHYCWEASSHPLEVHVADCPPELLRLVASEARQARSHLPATGDASRSFLARAFQRAGLRVGFDLPNGAVTAECPWGHEHTDGRGLGDDSSTVLLPPTADLRLGSFSCQHGHCKGRTVVDVLLALPPKAVGTLKSELPVEFSIACSLVRARRRRAA